MPLAYLLATVVAPVHSGIPYNSCLYLLCPTYPFFFSEFISHGLRGRKVGGA
jgi:hypothetical protein